MQQLIQWFIEKYIYKLYYLFSKNIRKGNGRNICSQMLHKIMGEWPSG